LGKTVTSYGSHVEPAVLSDTAMVGALRDGNVQARTPRGEFVTLQTNQQIPSGSEIVTDQGRVALVLPGNGRLWINRNSSLVLSFRGSLTQVALKSGEISYKAPSGSLLLTSSGIQVADAKAVDVKLQGDMLAICVSEKSASVSAKGKTVKVNAGQKATVALSGDSALQKDSFAGVADSWRLDLVLPGEGSSDTPKTITSDPGTSGTKRSRSAQPRLSGSSHR
jgi:ferric-dicitrate binding protein FerR (iron transport regulator)